MKTNVPSIELEKKIYKKLEHIGKDIEALSKAHYRVMSMLIPKAKPTKKEIEMFKERVKEKIVSLKNIEKRLENG